MDDGEFEPKLSIQSHRAIRVLKTPVCPEQASDRRTCRLAVPFVERLSLTDRDFQSRIPSAHLVFGFTPSVEDCLDKKRRSLCGSASSITYQRLGSFGHLSNASSTPSPSLSRGFTGRGMPMLAASRDNRACHALRVLVPVSSTISPSGMVCEDR